MNQHQHQQKDEQSQNVQQNIAVAFILNLVFTIIEVAGGLLTNSVAILSDAVHDFGDTVSLGLAWYSEKLAQKQPDSRFTYGYRRFSVLAALINAVFLLSASVFVMSQAVPLILHPGSVNDSGMIWLSVLGIIFNGAAVFRLKGNQSINQKVVRLHLLEDTLGWIAVLIGAIVIHYTSFHWIDPLLGTSIAIYIAYNAVINLRDSLRIFLQAIPDNTNQQFIQNQLLAIDGVDSIHDVRTWTIDGSSHIYTLHVVAQKGITASDYPHLKEEIRHELSHSGFQFVTIEIDSFEESCALNLQEDKTNTPQKD